MPYIFRTVKQTYYNPCEHQSPNIEQTSKGRYVILSNEYGFDWGGWDPNVASFVASMLVRAEQCLQSATPLFVAVYEVEYGQGITVDTPMCAMFHNANKAFYARDGALEPSASYVPTHIKGANSWTYEPTRYYWNSTSPGSLFYPSTRPMGFRGEITDVYMGITVAFGCEKGYSRHAYYMACVSPYDFYTKQNGTIKMHDDNSLDYKRFELYQAYMYQVLPCMGRAYINKDGILTEGEYLSGEITLKHITDFRQHRRAELAKSQNEIDFTHAYLIGLVSVYTAYSEIESKSVTHSHEYASNGWDAKTFDNVAVEQYRFFAFLFNSFLPDGEQGLEYDKYLFTGRGPNGLDPRGLLDVKYNRTHFLEVMQPYIAFWNDAYTEEHTPTWSAHFANSFIGSGDSIQYIGPYNAPSTDQFPNKERYTYLWEQAISERGSEVMRAIELYFPSWENCIRFLNLICQLERFISPKSGPKQVVSGVQKVFSQSRMSRRDYLRLLPEYPYSSYEEQRVQGLAIYKNSTHMPTPYNLSWIYSIASYCGDPFDLSHPGIEEKRIVIVTKEEPKKPAIPCGDRLSVHLGQRVGVDYQYEVKRGKSWITDRILDVYRYYHCEDNPSVVENTPLQPSRAPTDTKAYP